MIKYSLILFSCGSHHDVVVIIKFDKFLDFLLCMLTL